MLNIYKASAGSGKTFTLAYQYIRLLLGTRDSASETYRLNLTPRDAHRHILAITFTVKATEEMKRRILHELAVLAGREPGWISPSPYLNGLCKLYRCTPNELKKAADIALNSILFDFNYFSISTIDSFFQMVLRTFAREAELSGNYDIELDNTVAIDYGVNQMISSFNHDIPTDKPTRDAHRQLGDWIFRYMESKIEEGSTFNLFNRASKVHSNLISFIKDVSGEDFMLSYDRMMEYLKNPELINRFAKALSERRTDIRETAVRHATEALAYIDDTILAVTTKSSPVGSRALELLRKIAQGKFPKSTGTTAPGILEDYDSKFLNKAGRDSGLDSDTIMRGLVTRAMQSYINTYTEGTMIDKITSNLFVLGLLGRVYANIEQYRADNDLILLSDTGTLLRGIIGDDDAPFVYERIGQWYNHFLIDEFQDTSIIQWSNIKPLIDESLSTKNDNLIIGDEKQCIYRFRDSDPTLLRDLHTLFPKRSTPLNDTLEGNTNWRSSAEVIKFNNTLFYFMGKDLGHESVYNGVVQPVPAKNINKHGYVKALIFSGGGRQGDRLFKEHALQHVVKDVKLAFDNGYTPADIAILVRSRSQGQSVINTLIDHKEEFGRPSLRVVSDDSMGISQSPSIRLIISIIRFLSTHNEPSDSRRISSRKIAELINRFEYNLSTGATEGEALLSALKQSSADNSNDLNADVTDMTCLTLPSLVERIITRFISPDKANKENLYITALQDLVMDFSERGGSDIRSFLSWWDSIGCNMTVSGAQDSEAIRVMTIHKSKGLEFKWVIVPFINEAVPRFKSPEWFEPLSLDWIHDQSIIPPLLPIVPGDWMESTPYATRYDELCKDELLDELNVTYVAMTRAADTLITYIYDDTRRMGQYVTEAINAATGEAIKSWTPTRQPVSPLATEPLIPLSPLLRPFEDEGNKDIVDNESPDGNLSISILEVGTPPSRAAETAKNLTALEPRQTLIMPPYSSCDHTDIWANTRLDDSTTLNAAGERGILLHDILSMTHHRADLVKSIRTMIRRGVIDHSQADEISTYLTERLEREDVAQWFEGFKRVLTERTIANAGARHDSHRRPDRIVWTADGQIAVIDYKTGAKRPKAHSAQVREYMNLLSSMGHTGITGYIWYLDTDTIMRVD